MKLLILASVRDVANRAAHVFDYDTGGAHTFGALKLAPHGEGEPTHYAADSLIREQFLAAFETPDSMFALLDQLATERGREPVTLADCQALHPAIWLGEAAELEITANNLQPLITTES